LLHHLTDFGSQDIMHSGADSPGYGDDVSIPNAAMSRPGMTKIAEKGDQHDCNSGKLPLRRREIRNHRTTAEPIKLPLARSAAYFISDFIEKAKP